MNDWFSHQFIDLTEVRGISNFRHQPCMLRFKEIPTEFVFAVSALYTYEDDVSRLAELGFKAVSTMNNWFPSHSYEVRPLTLHWLKLREKQASVPSPIREKWQYVSDSEYAKHCVDMAISGCGFKIAEGPPLSRTRFHKFFTLIRMPLMPLGLHVAWLKKHNFRQIDTGSLSSYWVNGWDPKTYNYDAIEKPYWAKRETIEASKKEATPVANSTK